MSSAAKQQAGLLAQQHHPQLQPLLLLLLLAIAQAHAGLDLYLHTSSCCGCCSCQHSTTRAAYRKAVRCCLRRRMQQQQQWRLCTSPWRRMRCGCRPVARRSTLAMWRAACGGGCCTWPVSVMVDLFVLKSTVVTITSSCAIQQSACGMPHSGYAIAACWCSRERAARLQWS